MTKQQLRRELISKRQRISPHQRLAAAKLITKQLSRTLLFQRSRHIAFYMPVKGEVNVLLLLNKAWKMNKACYLPVLHPLKHNRLYFMRFLPTDILLPNRYGILEPEINSKKLIPAWALDLVFMPLVGFDSDGSRLGSGAGFYDRTFAFCKTSSHTSPVLVGLGYELQRIEKIDPNIWDVSLQWIATEKKIYQGG